MHLFDIQDINRRRALRWHPSGLEEWSVLEWAGAMCGEAGEAANIAKKMIRVRDNLGGNEVSDHKLMDELELKRQLSNEIGGTLLYLCLLASRAGIDIEAAVCHEFNRKSEQLDFPERLRV